ncbi:MAG TPA: diadenylate cyclase [Desulfatirhabdiaceae bacterium]|nr:diadenylate cyclase [Desulfatirhabdiaceae bacterium]
MDYILYFLNSIRWQDVVDITLNSYILFRFYVLFRKTNVFKILIGIAGLWFFQQIAVSVGLIVTSWVVQAITTVAALIIIVVFRNEIRSVLQTRNLKAILWGFSQKSLNAPVQIIAESAFDLAKKRIGALIVIPGKEDLNEAIQNGIPVNGEISREMISSIFWPDNPVHDGAMLIEGNQITEVGVILPLSYRQDLPSYYGTRHRAAVGIAEMTDAMVIVVSEERGTILAIKGSRIQRILKVEDLITVLQEHTGETDNTKKSIRRDRMEFLAAAMVSFMVITGIWLTIARGLDTLVTLESPIEYMNRSPAIEIMDASVNSVRIQLGGSGALIKSIRPEQVRVRIDLGRSFVGSNTFTITNENISLPPGVFIKSFQPSAVDVILDIPVSKEIPIQVDWTGKLPENLRIERVTLDPEKITVVGGSQILKNIQTIYTEKIPLDNLTTSRSMTVNLALRPASLKVGPGFREKLVVEYVIKEKTAKEGKP